MPVPTLFLAVTAFVFGVTIGSFLNVVIYRLPLGKSIAEPAQSFCPNCGATLQAIDLVPLLSFLFLGRKCRRCKQPISWRYFTVELATGILFTVLFLRYPQNAPTSVALMLFGAVMVPVYCIDFATFTIPDSLNLIALVIALGRDVFGIVTHEAGHALLMGWLPRSVLGAVVGTLIFGLVRILGWVWKRQEAMGLGDPLLARAMGAMLVSLTPPGHNPLRLFIIWVVLSTFSGAIVGPALIWWRSRTARPVTESGAEEDLEPETPSTLMREIGDIVYCLCLGDALDWVRRLRAGPDAKEAEPVAEDFGPMAPTAIPFGPFLVIGFLATVFVGDWLTTAYLAYALPHST